MSETLADREISRGQSSRLLTCLEIAAVSLAAWAFYVGLHGELPFHDVARFVGQIQTDRPVWDIGHIYMQPATLFWHRHLGFGGSAEASQKAINAVAAALSAGVFAAILLRLNIQLWQRILAVALLVGSCSMVTLAPSGHMKLLAAPFLAGALYFALAWEQGRAAPSPAPDRRDLVLSAIFLALAASLLASSLATAPFVTVLAIIVARRTGDEWRTAVTTGVVFAAVCGLVFTGLVCLGFLLIAGQPLSLNALTGSVALKAGLLSQAVSPTTRVLRSVFSSVNNFAATPDFGSLARAWLGGEIPTLAPYVGVLARNLIPFVATLGLLIAIYVKAGMQMLRGATVFTPIAFLLGAQAWGLYCTLNDPEHWFLATAPTIVLFIICFSASARRLILPVWSIATVALNLWVIGIPTKLYPMSMYQAELTKSLTQRDLLVYFAAYPGGQNIEFFSLPVPQHLVLDQVLLQDGNVDANYAQARHVIDTGLQSGGKVLAFDVLSPERWDAPWPDLKAHGIGKAKLLALLRQDYCIRQLPDMAEIPTWQLLPRPACAP